MGKFIRFAYGHVQDFLVSKSEKCFESNDHIHDDFPYSLNYGESKVVLLHFPKQVADSLIVIEPFDIGKNVVLQGHYGRKCTIFSLRSPPPGTFPFLAVPCSP